MSKKLVTAVFLVWGTALAANCGGGSDDPANGHAGSSGDAGEAGEPSGGTKNTAGMGGKGGTTAGNGGTTTMGGETSEAGQSMGGETQGGAAGMAAGGEAGAAGNDAGGAGGADAGVCPATIDLYPGVFAKAVCDKRVDCCMSDADKCMMDVGAAIDKIYTELVKAEQAGKAATNCGALEKCVAAINAAKCEDWPTQTGTAYGIPVDEPACRHFIEPQVKATEACTDTYQCIDGVCDVSDTKVCIAIAEDGATCPPAVCNGVTSYCDTATKKCAPKLENGSTCAKNTDCQSRVCDTGNTDKCIAPGPTRCEYVPAAGCSLAFAAPRGGFGWSLLAGFVTLGVALRRRRRV